MEKRIAISSPGIGAWFDLGGAIIFALMAGGLCAMLAATMGQGFDFSDEAFYMLSYRPAAGDYSFTSGFLYFHPVFALTGGDIQAMRLTGLAVIVLSGLALGFALSRLLKRYDLMPEKRPATWGIPVVVLVGALAHYYPYIRTPNYNVAIAALTNLLAAGLCLIATEPRRRPALVWAFATGIVLGISFFVKVSTVPGFGLLTGTAVLLGSPSSLRTRLYMLPVVAGGIAVWCGIHFLLIESFSQWYSALAANLAMLRHANPMHDTAMVNRYGKEMHNVVRGLRITIFPGLVAMAALAVLARCHRHADERPVAGFAIVLALSNLVAWGMFAGLYGWQFTGRLIFEIYLLFVIVWTAGLLASARLLAMPGAIFFQHFVIIAALLCLPIASAIGTGNPLECNAMFAVAPLFAGLVIIARLMDRAWNFQFVSLSTMLVLAGFATAQVISGAFHPYGVWFPIFQEHEVTTLSPGTTLKVDAISRDYIASIAAKGREIGITPDTDVIALFDSPSVPFLTGGRSPLTPTYTSDNFEVTRSMLASLPLDRVRRAVLAIRQPAKTDIDALLPAGLTLENDFTPAGKAGLALFGEFEFYVPK